MKNLILVIVATIFLFSCGGSSMEKDAKKLAKLTWNAEYLAKKVDAGDNSVSSEADRLSTELKATIDEFQKKYPEDGKGPEFAAIYKKEYDEISKNPPSNTDNEALSTSSENKKSESNPISDELNNKTKQILKSNIFVKINGLTSMIAYNFDDNHFTFRVLAINGTELSRANGTYHISPAIDGSIAKITLIKDGPIQKSPMYADNGGIDTELFLHFNRELLLKPLTEELLSQLNMLDLMGASKEAPDYLLMGRDAFASKRIKTQAEKDSIANQNRIMEEKKKDLEEKLKGF